jgi:TolB-like protein
MLSLRYGIAGVCLLTFLAFGNAPALEKMSIAVMDLEPQAVDSSVARTLSDIMRTELLNTGRFEVLERAQMSRLIEEMKLQQTGLTDVQDAAQLGKMLNVEKLIIGSIGLMGTTYHINVRLVDVAKAVTELAERAECRAREDELPGTITSLINKIALRIPLRGTIVEVESEKVYIDIGGTHGIQSGLTLRVVRKGEPITDLQGNVLGTTETNIGVILIEEVHPMWSVATVYGEAATDMERGDWVLLDLTEAQTMETPAKDTTKKKEIEETKKQKPEEEGEGTDFEPPPAF